jgi:hypothetical protein
MASIEEIEARIVHDRKLLRREKAAAKRRALAEYADACRRLGEQLAKRNGLGTAAAIDEYLSTARHDAAEQAEPGPAQPQPAGYANHHEWQHSA